MYEFNIVKDGEDFVCLKCKGRNKCWCFCSLNDPEPVSICNCGMPVTVCSCQQSYGLIDELLEDEY